MVYGVNLSRSAARDVFNNCESFKIHGTIPFSIAMETSETTVISRSRFLPEDARKFFLDHYAHLLDASQECDVAVSCGARGFWAETFLLVLPQHAKYFMKIIPPHYPDLEQVKYSLLVLQSLATLSLAMKLLVPGVYTNSNGT